MTKTEGRGDPVLGDLNRKVVAAEHVVLSSCAVQTLFSVTVRRDCKDAATATTQKNPKKQQRA